MQNSTLNRLLFAIVTRPFIRRYEIRCANARDGCESLSPVRTIYISFFCFLIDRNAERGQRNNEIDHVDETGRSGKNRAGKPAGALPNVSCYVERLIFAIEKKRSPRFLIYSKNYMQLPPPPSAPASVSRR